jgi:hypothetical protein
MNCSHCPNFYCILKSDYSRHILTKTHIKNKQLHDAMYSLHIKNETIESAMYSLHTRDHDLLIHQRRIKAVLKQYWKQADYAIHVFKHKRNFAEIHDYLIATNYAGHCY